MSMFPEIISKNQRAFVPRRLMCDSVIIATKILHAIEGGAVDRRGCVELMLDMKKAYDREEWPFLYKIMNRLGFFWH